MARIVALTADALFTYATNSGELYDDHIALTKGHYSRSAWSLHIADKIVPGYCREFHTPGGILPTDEKHDLVFRLQEYYRKHLVELTA